MRVRASLVVSALLAALVALPAAAAPAGGAATWARVSFADRIVEADRVALLDAGLSGLQYVPDDAYLAYGDAGARRAAAAVDGVAAVEVVPPQERLSAELRGLRGTVTVRVLTADGATDRTAARLASLGAVTGRGDLRGDGAIAMLTATLDAALLDEVAARPEVLRVEAAPTAPALEDEGSSQVMAGNLEGGRPVPGYDEFLADLGIDGSGVVMSVVDDGIDFAHPEFLGAIAHRFSYGVGDRAVPSLGHGTHVAGIMAGRGASAGPLGPVRDSDGLAYGMGVAPGMTLVDQPALTVPIANRNDTLRPVAPFPPADGFRGMVGDALSEGAVGWNGSWTDGGGVGAGYTANGASLDALTRDGDAEEPGDQPFTFVFSAGNSGSAEGTRITSPKEAKNLIVVAASQSHRSGNIERVASFSSRGPARDGRIVPTITAPGQTIISARATTGVLCTAPLSGLGDAPPPDGLGLYTGCSGTSMASPQVAGAVALVHDWWRQRNDGDDPSPAMVRALLVNSAKDLGTPDIPNRDEGWGRVDLRALFDPAAARVLVDQSVVLEEPDEAHTVTVRALDASQPVKVTLAWTDPPGMPSAEDPALVNDLDLEVLDSAGAAYLGNVFADGASISGGAPDRLNNLEQVHLLPADDGTITVTVRAANLPGDGVPGAGSGTDQDFALVLTNAEVVE